MQVLWAGLTPWSQGLATRASAVRKKSQLWPAASSWPDLPPRFLMAYESHTVLAPLPLNLLAQLLQVLLLRFKLEGYPLITKPDNNITINKQTN